MTMPSTLRFVFLVFWLLGIGAAAAQTTRTLPADAARAGAAKRIALVMGVDRYQNVPALTNAVADAETMALTLNKVGYEVRVVHNPTQREAQDELLGVAQRLQGGDEVVFFFSGHGVQINGQNYLLPRDVRAQSDGQVRNDALLLGNVLDELRDRKPRFMLAVIDACRDNPFQSSGKAIGSRGLTRVAGAEGQMVIYAAGEGQQALDRLGPNDTVRNGLFTRVFAQQMTRPGVPVHEVLRGVRDEVYRLAQGVNHVQVPAIYDQMLGSFYFVPPGGAAPAVTAAPTAAVPSTAAAPAGGRTSLDDLEREDRARREWAQWQQRMQADFDRVASFQGNADLQVQAWRRFLQTWTQDNPISGDDESLRAQAQARLAQAERAVQVAAVAPAPRPAAIPDPAPATSTTAARWPTKVVTLIVPFAAGGPTDRFARDLGEALRRQANATVVIENVGGAGGTLGAGRVAKAEADGHTLLFHHIGMATTPGFYRSASFRPLDDFEFAGLVNEIPMVLFGRNTLPAGNFAELQRWLDANRGRATFANAGLGSASHLCGLWLQQSLRLDVAMVPYKGTAPAINDLIGGQVDLMCDQVTNVASQAEARRVKPFASTSRVQVAGSPFASLPAAVPGVDMRVWHGVYAPRGTSVSVIQAINNALRSAMKDPTFVRAGEQLGAVTVSDERATPAGHRRFVEAQVATWTAAIRAGGQFAD